jgi:hypothetical protein
MFRILIVLILIAGVAGYFTKPAEAELRSAAEHTLAAQRDEAVSNMDLGGMISSGAASVFGEGHFDDWLVMTHYSQTLNAKPYVDCYGAFKQTQCTLAPHGGEAQPAT